MDKLNLKWAKILDHGTSNPIVNRLVPQFDHIFQSHSLKLPEENIEQIRGCLFECMKDLLWAEDCLKKYTTLEGIAIEKASKLDSTKLAEGGISYEDPTIELVKLFEDFLIRCVIVLRRTRKIAEHVFMKELKSLEKLRAHLREVLKDDKFSIKMLGEDQIWYKELYDIRGEVEHSNLQISRFEVMIHYGVPAIVPPVLVKKKCLVRKYMEVTIYNVFTYCEDFTAMLLNTCCDEVVHIIQLPKELQSRHDGFKYILDLKEEVKRKWFGEVNS